MAAAKRLRGDIGIRREILLDDLDGTTHTAYGLMPNMTWVLGRRGIILYKSMWTSAASVAAFIERFSDVPDFPHAPFYTEQLDYRARDEQRFYELLERNGPRSVTEFRRANELWTERMRAARKEQR